MLPRNLTMRSIASKTQIANTGDDLCWASKFGRDTDRLDKAARISIRLSLMKILRCNVQKSNVQKSNVPPWRSFSLMTYQTADVRTASFNSPMGELASHMTDPVWFGQLHVGSINLLGRANKSLSGVGVQSQWVRRKSYRLFNTQVFTACLEKRISCHTGVA